MLTKHRIINEIKFLENEVKDTFGKTVVKHSWDTEGKYYEWDLKTALACLKEARTILDELTAPWEE